MTYLQTGDTETLTYNPVDIAEELAGSNEWDYERHSDQEITFFLANDFTDLQFRLVWRADLGTLQFACLFDVKIPDGRIADIYKTIGLANERLWIGHFEYWHEEGILLFRHASLATTALATAISEDHIATIIDTALGECERFFPVFQFVIWGGQTPEDAVDNAMLDCAGSA